MVVITPVKHVRGVEVRDIRYDSNGYSVPAYIARPKKAASLRAGVIVGQEAWGITDHIRDVCANLAAEGYVAIVPDYYARTGAPIRDPGGDHTSAVQAIDRIYNPTILNDYRSAIKYLVAKENCDPKRVGAIGFCTGGTIQCSSPLKSATSHVRRCFT